ncbi:MAG: ABC transporter permease [Treponema sp.]|nr:ABC transporter permease [Treponema sp.]
MIDEKRVKNLAYKNDQNAWFETDDRGFVKTNSATGKVRDIFIKDETSPDGNAYYVSRMNGSQFETRVLYSEWYRYEHGEYATYLFGTDESGYDIFTRLAHGGRLSLLISICVASINLILGIIIGAIEGYYGGTLDLVLERIKDILYQVPSVVLMTLFQMYFAKKLGPVFSMFFAFIFFGWIGTSSTVRAQFYRFKGQEYVMASRTLGAKDSRLIFRHILPNAAGFIITASVLTIPAVIFSEANLTYLGIVNLQSDTMTSVGTMLNTAQSALSTHPHCVFFPAAFISILLVCFNEFGNGLRDAFNPTLRGAQ